MILQENVRLKFIRRDWKKNKSSKQRNNSFFYLAAKIIGIFLAINGNIFTPDSSLKKNE